MYDTQRAAGSVSSGVFVAGGEDTMAVAEHHNLTHPLQMRGTPDEYPWQ